MTISWRVPVLLAIGLIPVIIWPHTRTVAAWTALVLCVVLIDFLFAASPRKLTVERAEPSPVRVGEESASAITLTGPRTMRGELRDAWQPSAGARENRHPFSLVPNEPLTITTTLAPTRRGRLYGDHITIRSWGPLRLAARQVSFDSPTQLRSLPEFPSRKHLPRALAKLQQIEGQALARQRGQGTEFDSLREWVEGDDVRSIDWRATARMDEGLIVRTWRPERDRHIVMVMDTSRLSAVRLGNVTRLDAQMDACLLLGAVCAKAGDNISFVAGDHTVHASVIKPGRRDVLRELSHAMMPLDASIIEADWTTLSSAVTKLGKKLSLIVILTPIEPNVLDEGLLPILVNLAKNNSVMIAAAIDPDTHSTTGKYDSAHEVYQAAAVARTSSRRAQAARALEHLGVTVVEDDPENLPMRIVDHYLALKSRGLL
ncbi:MAG: DUF58 domain-containing protein [Actinomycetaceae bacterium]|nr:DUF58 domain-containing protein [Actinomycetaceae bacterium]